MKKMIDIDFGSSRYDELVELRYKVLLEPLGLKFLDKYREKEIGYLHIGCLDSLENKLVGGLMLIPVNDEEIRMMQVAVDTKHQREGIGHEMVKYAETRAKKAGYSRLVMNAMLSKNQGDPPPVEIKTSSNSATSCNIRRSMSRKASSPFSAKMAGTALW